MATVMNLNRFEAQVIEGIPVLIREIRGSTSAVPVWSSSIAQIIILADEGVHATRL